MPHERLLRTIDRRFSEFRASYRGLTDEELIEPGVTGEWSVRDLISHVTWWEEEALAHIPTIVGGERTQRYSTAYGGIDAFNALMTRQRAHRPLAEVHRQQDLIHAKLVTFVASLPAAIIATETRARRRLRLDTYGHYPLHTEQIIAWRERTGRAIDPPEQPTLFPTSK